MDLNKEFDFETLPHSNEAEIAVIGGLIHDNSLCDEAFNYLKEEDFYRKEHKLIFRAITELINNNQPADVITIIDNIKRTSKIEDVGGDEYLNYIANNIAGISNLKAYILLVRDKAISRKLIQVSSEIAMSAFSPDGRDIKSIISEAESKIVSILEGNNNEPTELWELASEAVKKLNSEAIINNGLTTGFTDLDKVIYGLHEGELIIIAGRPSMGKTSFAMNIAEHVATKEKKPVLVFSMEMTGESLAMRMLASKSKIEQRVMRGLEPQYERCSKIYATLDELSKASILIDDTPTLSPTEIMSRARIASRKKKLGLIVIDYLQLMQISGFKENRNAEITAISRSLKILAKELQVPVIALSQLNRGVEQRNDKRPMMSDLRESGAIEQDADIIILIYRDEVYNENSPDKGIAEIIVAKHRNGPIGAIKLTFIGSIVRFENHYNNFYNNV